MKTNILSYQKSLNFLIYLFPLSFILGNFFTNLSIFLISIIGIIFYKKELFDIKQNNIFIIIIAFFVVLILSTILEGYKIPEHSQIEKSIFFLRYLIFFFVLRCMVLKEHLDLKGFFLSSLFFSSVVSLDVIFQYFFGYNILGFESGDHRRSSFFNEEIIAGGYIQRFSVLGLFAIFFIIKKNSLKTLFFLFVLTICFLGILMSGNRMPTIMFLFFLLMFLIVFSFKKLKYFPQIALALIVTIFVFSVSSFENFKANYISFWGGMPLNTKVIDELKRDYPELEKYKNSGKQFHLTKESKNKDKYEILQFHTGHAQVYITSVDKIRDNPLIGRGIRSFRTSCWEKIYLPNRTCQSHPHNYYLEIINDTGLVGLVILILPIGFLLIKNFRKHKNRANLFFYPLFFSIIIEFFPLRSSGSFFSTSNAAFVFFILGAFIGLIELKKNNSYNKINFF